MSYKEDSFDTNCKSLSIFIFVSNLFFKLLKELSVGCRLSFNVKIEGKRVSLIHLEHHSKAFSIKLSESVVKYG